MLFSSLTFLFAFLPLTLIFYYVPVFEKAENELAKKNVVLLSASLVFYAWGEPVYVILMLLSIYFNFNIGLDISAHYYSRSKQKALLVTAVVFNLLVLGFFKYSGFVVDNINSIFSLGIEYKPLALPIGISFYTFQAMSYVIDVYREKVDAQNKLLPFALYITMFPQLIAGPIVQYKDIASALTKREMNSLKFTAGIMYFIRGLGKKVVFANTVGAVYTEISSGDVSKLPFVTAWLGIICYTLQIYFDFSGYSDMAIGLGKMFGFEFCQNFNFPYISKSIKEFWSRWHISLSTWFKDYVYIPLGGNRKGTARTILNTAIVWSLTGLWHGASWNFVLWGAFYAVLLIAEKFVFANVIEKIPTFLRHLLTMILVCIGWALFSGETLGSTLGYLGSMFGFGGGFMDDTSLYYLKSYFLPLVIMSLSAFGVYRFIPRPKKIEKRFVLQSVGYLAIFVLCIICLVSDTYNPFLYFRF